MSVESPSVSSLIARHRASHKLSLTARLVGWLLPQTTPESPAVLAVSTGPQDRWRVERDSETVYVRNGDDALCRRRSQMHRIEPGTRQMGPLQPVNPLWFFGAHSMLANWAQHAPTTATVAEAVTIDGRTGWPIVSTGLTLGDFDDKVQIVVDDSTGVVLQIASSSGRLVGQVRDLEVVTSFSDDTFEWAGEIAVPPDDHDDPVRRNRVFTGQSVAFLGDDQPYGNDPGARFQTLHRGHPGRIVDVTDDAAVVRWFLFEDIPMRVPFSGDETDASTRVLEQITDISEGELARRERNISKNRPPQS